MRTVQNTLENKADARPLRSEWMRRLVGQWDIYVAGIVGVLAVPYVARLLLWSFIVFLRCAAFLAHL